MNQQPTQHQPKSLPNCMVVIPAHNEAQDIAWVVGEIQKFSAYTVVVVDDASSDGGSGSTARAAGAVGRVPWVADGAMQHRLGGVDEPRAPSRS